ncbi:MAG TPA: acyltransferase [Mucilaginibacter sp.]|nr:acyltransferase [Mucilaginibacter sp.]
MIHALADVQSQNIGDNTNIWQFVVVLAQARIGSNCNINCHVFIENDVKIGDYVTVKSGVYLWDGIEIENNVFIGPNVTFTNDKTPRSKQYPKSFLNTRIKRHASIGAASIILGGVVVGEYAMIGAGALVTSDVPDRALMKGSPAKIAGWLNDDGSKMEYIAPYYHDNKGGKWQVMNNKLIKV